MWKRSNGFLLVDLLFTLSAWLMIATLFVPVMLRLHTYAYIDGLRYEATQLLYEEMMTVDMAVLPKTIFIDERPFQLFSHQDNQICLSYYDQQEVMICERY